MCYFKDKVEIIPSYNIIINWILIQHLKNLIECVAQRRTFVTNFGKLVFLVGKGPMGSE